MERLHEASLRPYGPDSEEERIAWIGHCVVGCVQLGQSPVFAVAPSRLLSMMRAKLVKALGEQDVELEIRGMAQLVAGKSTVFLVDLETMRSMASNYPEATIVDPGWSWGK